MYTFRIHRYIFFQRGVYRVLRYEILSLTEFKINTNIAYRNMRYLHETTDNAIKTAGYCAVTKDHQH